VTATQPELPDIDWNGCRHASRPRPRTSRRPAPATPAYQPPDSPRRRPAVAPPNWGDLHGQRADPHDLHRMATVQLVGSYL
jgi:hypothetical protein